MMPPSTIFQIYSGGFIGGEKRSNQRHPSTICNRQTYQSTWQRAWVRV